VQDAANMTLTSFYDFMKVVLGVSADSGAGVGIYLKGKERSDVDHHSGECFYIFLAD
jgi:hypothetical protein